MKKKRCEIIDNGHGNYEVRRRFEPTVRFCPVNVQILRIDPPEWLSRRTTGPRNVASKEQKASHIVQDPIWDLNEIIPSISSDSELEEASAVCSTKTELEGKDGPKKKSVVPELIKKPLSLLKNGKEKEREPKISGHDRGSSSATGKKGTTESKKSSKEVLPAVVNGKPKGKVEVPSKTSEPPHSEARSNGFVKQYRSSSKIQSGPPSGSKTAADVSLKKTLKSIVETGHGTKKEVNGKESHLKKAERTLATERLASFEEQLSASCKTASVSKAAVTAMTLNGSHSNSGFQKSSNAESVNGLGKNKNTTKISAFPGTVKEFRDEVDSSTSSLSDSKSEPKHPNKSVTNSGIGPLESSGREKHGLLNGKNVQSSSNCKLSTHPMSTGTTATETNNVVLPSEKSSFKSKETTGSLNKTIDSGAAGPKPDRLKTAVFVTPASSVTAAPPRKVPAHAKVRNPFFATTEDNNSVEDSTKFESAVKMTGKNPLFSYANVIRSDANAPVPKPAVADNGPAQQKPPYPGSYQVPRGPEKGINPFRVNPSSVQSNGCPPLLPQQKLMQPFKIPRKVKSPPPPPPPVHVEAAPTFKRIRIDPNPSREKFFSQDESCESPLVSSSLRGHKNVTERSAVAEKKISDTKEQVDFEPKSNGFVSDKEIDEVSSDDGGSDDEVNKLNPPSVSASNFQDDDDLDILQIHPEDEDDSLFF